MIVLQWEETGVSRVHLGILSRRQFDASGQQLRHDSLATSVAWLVDDFRGSWIERDLSGWLDRIAACVAAVPACSGPRRHAVVVASGMVRRVLRRLLRLDLAAVRPGGMTRLFDCPLAARRWAEEA